MKTKLLLIICVILALLSTRSAKAQETHYSIFLPAVSNGQATIVEEKDVIDGGCWSGSNRCSWIVTRAKFDELLEKGMMIDFLGTSYTRVKVYTLFSNTEFESLIWSADGDGLWLSRQASPLEGEQKVIFYGSPQ
jgi:hypothetical protein